MKRVTVNWTETATTEYEHTYDVPDDFTVDEDEDAILELIVGGDTDWSGDIEYLSVDERSWTYEVTS